MGLTGEGHAMIALGPGIGIDAAFWNRKVPQQGHRLHLSHADLSGDPVFEEAFSCGKLRGMAATWLHQPPSRP